MDDLVNAENNDSSSSLRRRTIRENEKSKNNEQPQKDDKTEGTGNTEKPLIKRKTRDPLNWFGVLVPTSLRESQRHFKQGH